MEIKSNLCEAWNIILEYHTQIFVKHKQRNKLENIYGENETRWNKCLDILRSYWKNPKAESIFYTYNIFYLRNFLLFYVTNNH